VTPAKDDSQNGAKGETLANVAMGVVGKAFRVGVR